jgi:hypothetical protein
VNSKFFIQFLSVATSLGVAIGCTSSASAGEYNYGNTPQQNSQYVRQNEKPVVIIFTNVEQPTQNQQYRTYDKYSNCNRSTTHRHHRHRNSNRGERYEQAGYYDRY